jgi:sRNA-binding carbon storage regulator CsrA
MDLRYGHLEVRGDRIRIGIDAPKEIPIQREELLVKGLAAVTAA